MVIDRHCGAEDGVGEYLGEELIHFAANAILLRAVFEIVLVCEEVVPNEWVVKEGLQDDIQKAGLTQVKEPPTTSKRYKSLRR